jgi:F-type H+-transporting ATPase subunit a
MNRLLCIVPLLALTLWLSVASLHVTADDHNHGTAPTAPAGHDTGHGEAKAPKDAGHQGSGHHELTAKEEVMDTADWQIFHSLGIHIPLGWLEKVGPYGFPTKYMVLELIAAAFVFFVYTGLAKRIASGKPAEGTVWNLAETMLTFVRDGIAKPNLGEHDADEYVPLLWTLFLFILVNNLMGLLPWMGSPTANIFMTGALALVVFLTIHGSAIAKMGLVHYTYALWPKIEIPFMFGFGFLLGLAINIMIFVIELFGTVIKCGVLAIRLFANMFAGHMVLASIMLLIYQSRHTESWAMFGTVTGIAVVGSILLSLLELFVAFLQAFIFVFLASLFIGMAVHPEH